MMIPVRQFSARFRRRAATWQGVRSRGATTSFISELYCLTLQPTTCQSLVTPAQHAIWASRHKPSLANREAGGQYTLVLGTPGDHLSRVGERYFNIARWGSTTTTTFLYLISAAQAKEGEVKKEVQIMKRAEVRQ
ncbi:hypothetical protein M405DRAFT_884415 [Rhizopogon salebrosus TDB-379]|nr:hypothetical protein M405DRAFT_884415 [Rhizopogon salebrosus TDB-379]